MMQMAYLGSMTGLQSVDLVHLSFLAADAAPLRTLASLPKLEHLGLTGAVIYTSEPALPCVWTGFRCGFHSPDAALQVTA